MECRPPNNSNNPANLKIQIGFVKDEMSRGGKTYFEWVKGVSGHSHWGRPASLLMQSIPNLISKLVRALNPIRMEEKLSHLLSPTFLSPHMLLMLCLLHQQVHWKSSIVDNPSEIDNLGLTNSVLIPPLKSRQFSPTTKKIPLLTGSTVVRIHVSGYKYFQLYQ